MLYEFISENRDEIISRCRAKVATRSVPPPTPAEIDNGVPVFLDQLLNALAGGGADRAIADSAVLHAHDLLVQGFTISQVVHDYGDVCQAITELAVDIKAPISTDDFRLLNRCLDDAIAAAVTQYGRERQQARDSESVRTNERLGVFAHELRNLVNTATFAFTALQTGNVGIGGSTGSVLGRSLTRLQTLVGRSLAEVRLTQGVQRAEAFLVSPFIDEVARGAALEAKARGVTLTVLPVDKEMTIKVDRQILEAIVGNLLQNAFKFTRPRSTVTLGVAATDQRVLIEIEDECGGLPTAAPSDLFRSFEQRGADRTGLGLGLAFCRWAAEMNDGLIYTRNLPDKGCVFTLDLPRVASPPSLPFKRLSVSTSV
jgi:signal transduction histidine kinase